MIRIAQLEDAAPIARIHVNTWRVAYAGIVPDKVLAGLSEEDCTESWREQLVDGRTLVLVAEKGGQMIGWAAGGASRDADGRGNVEIYAIYVLPEHWGRGVGHDLMARLEDALPNVQEITLWVLGDNRRAIRFYEKMGYQADGATKEVQLGVRSLVEIRLRKSGTGLAPG